MGLGDFCFGCSRARLEIYRHFQRGQHLADLFVLLDGFYVLEILNLLFLLFLLDRFNFFAQSKWRCGLLFWIVGKRWGKLAYVNFGLPSFLRRLE